MDENEQFVRSVWDGVNWGASNYEGSEFGVVIYDDSQGTGFRCKTQSEAWQAAADFTRERLEEVRQLQEEIELLGGDLEVELPSPLSGEIRTIFDRESAIYERVISRLQAILADKTRGMKEGSWK